MKKISSAIIAVTSVAAVWAFAQPVIGPRDIPREPGQILEFWTAADMVDGIEVDVGLAGEERRWDLTGYQFDEVTADTLIDPDDAPDGDLFPASNRVVRSSENGLGMNIGGSLQYHLVADSGWYLLGVSGAGPLGLPIRFPEPILILPLPAEYGAEWNIDVEYMYGFPAPDTLMGGILDSVYIRVEIGGFAAVDGWGVAAFSGGEVPALRQRIATGGRVNAVGVRYLFNRRIEVELPFGYEIEASQSYRWLTAVMGEIAAITSLAGENEPDFDRASQVRVRRIVPALQFPPDTLNFGVVHIGNSGLAGIILQNNGAGLGSIARFEFSGDVGQEMEALFQLPFIVNPDSSGRMRFLWTPREGRSLFGQTLRLFHNDPDVDNPFIIPLAGATPGYESVKRGITPADRFEVGAAHPNPFNSTVSIPFRLEQPSPVKMKLFSIQSEVIMTADVGNKQPGSHNLTIAGEGLPAGIYYAQLTAGGETVVVKLALVR